MLDQTRFLFFLCPRVDVGNKRYCITCYSCIKCLLFAESYNGILLTSAYFERWVGICSSGANLLKRKGELTAAGTIQWELTDKMNCMYPYPKRE
jgi:hypothetical protein